MECFVRGGKNCMGCFVRGDKNCMGCFVRGGKLMRDVLSGVAKNGMGCFVPGGTYIYKTLYTKFRWANLGHLALLLIFSRNISAPKPV